MRKYRIRQVNPVRFSAEERGFYRWRRLGSRGDLCPGMDFYDQRDAQMAIDARRKMLSGMQTYPATVSEVSEPGKTPLSTPERVGMALVCVVCLISWPGLVWDMFTEPFAWLRLARVTVTTLGAPIWVYGVRAAYQGAW